MHGDVPVDKRLYILADSQEEALAKAEPQLKIFRKKWGKGEVVASVVTLQNLIPCRNSSGDGRMGWTSTEQYRDVSLSLDEDKKEFRLAVCLVPIKQ